MTTAPSNVAPSPKPPKLFKSSAFSVRKDIVSTSHDVITTTTLLPTHNDRNIHFRIDRASNKIVNLSLLKIHIQFNIRDRSVQQSSGGKEKIYDSILVGNPLGTMFKDVKIRLNGVIVTEADGMYGYILNHLMLTKIPRHIREAVTQSGKVYEDFEETVKIVDIDDPSKSVLDFRPSLWRDLDIRKEWYSVKNPKPVDICSYLFTDLSVGPEPIIVPPNVDIDIELVPNDATRAILSSTPGKGEPYIEITKAELIVPRIVAKSDAARSLEHEFFLTRASVVLIPENVRNFHQIVSLSNSVPTRLTLMLCAMDSYNGTGSANMYSSFHHNLRSASFNIGGETYTVTPSDMDFDSDVKTELYLRTAEALRFSLNRTDQQLPPIEEWANRRFFFTLDLSKDYSADSNWVTPSEKGTISLDLRFDKATSSQLIGVLITESLGAVKMTSGGSISLLTPE